MINRYGDTTGAPTGGETAGGRGHELLPLAVEETVPDDEGADWRREAEAARQQARALEEQLAGITGTARAVAHLLSNDLTLAVGFIELLQAHPALPPELRAFVDGAADGLAAASQDVARLHRELRAAAPTALPGEEDLP